MPPTPRQRGQLRIYRAKSATGKTRICSRIDRLPIYSAAWPRPYPVLREAPAVDRIPVVGWADGNAQGGWVVGDELLTAAEMSRADALAIAGGVTGLTLMENAGAAVAETAAKMLARAPAAIAVACGPGNNGGDGFVAARRLREAGHKVRLGLLGQREALKGDAAAMASRWGDAIEPLTPAILADADLVIDALFGAGLSRPLEGTAADVVAAINASGKPVVAVDVPSGLDGTSGAAAGPVVKATRTVT